MTLTLSPTRCPVCRMPGGFHDTEDIGGQHAAAGIRIPSDLTWPSNNAKKRQATR